MSALSESVKSESSVGTAMQIIKRNTQRTRRALLEEGISKLNNLIALEEVKTQIHEFVCNYMVREQAEIYGLISLQPQSYHMAFLGNPGTGKTETARCLPEILCGLGITETPSFTEVSRTDLVGEYIGKSEARTKEILEEVINYGGVLFIDEFPQLAMCDSSRDFGHVVIKTLVSYLENYRNHFVCIVAGYPKEMEQAINSDPGLQSRFSIFLNFPDYSTEELITIFKLFSTRNSHFIEQIDASVKFGDLFMVNSKKNKLIHEMLTEEIQRLSKIYTDFGNGRAMRKLYEIAERVQAVRIWEEHMLYGQAVNREEFIMNFIMFTEEDLRIALNKLEQELKMVKESSKDFVVKGFSNYSA